jgi:hypothetical protein
LNNFSDVIGNAKIRTLGRTQKLIHIFYWTN